MESSRRSNRSVPAALTAAMVVVAACSDVPTDTSHLAAHRTTGPVAASTPSAGLVKAVHAATARYHSTTQAAKNGYAEASPCVAHPTLGGMGFHWVNDALVDPAFDPLAPEAVLYEPNGKGKRKLVAVEYIVINVGQPAPTFDGQPFDVGGTPIPVPHWSLHLWVHKDNPSGIFTPFNPTVSCP